MGLLLGYTFREVRTPIITKSKHTDPQSAIFGGVSIPQTARHKTLNINKIASFIALKPYKTAKKALFGPFWVLYGRVLQSLKIKVRISLHRQ